MINMDEKHFFRYNPWWDGEYEAKGLFERPSLMEMLEKNSATRQILLLTGLRRIGKTSLMKLLVRYFIKQSICDARDILYISLDDYLIGDTPIIEIVEKFRAIHRHPFEKKLFLFFDEITHHANFEVQLKNLYDHQNVKIVAASSCASLLKSKKALLTGRNVLVEVLPLDFYEFLSFTGRSLRAEDSHLLEPYFEEFLQTGGIPEYVLHKDSHYLQQLVDDIIIKDIALPHNLRDVRLLQDFFLLLMERAGKVASINKLAHVCKISPDTSRRMFDLFCESYLIYPLLRHGTTNERMLSPRKIYAPDLGIRTFYTGFRDKGSLFENYVFFKIKHKNPQYYYCDGLEIDFFTQDQMLIEVKYGTEMTEKQKELFERVKAEKRLQIKSISDIEKLD
jgi:predicted AAA+ superfamily ATPase